MGIRCRPSVGRFAMTMLLLGLLLLALPLVSSEYFHAVFHGNCLCRIHGGIPAAHHCHSHTQSSSEDSSVPDEDRPGHFCLVTLLQAGNLILSDALDLKIELLNYVVWTPRLAEDPVLSWISVRHSRGRAPPAAIFASVS